MKKYVYSKVQETFTQNSEIDINGCNSVTFAGQTDAVDVSIDNDLISGKGSIEISCPDAYGILSGTVKLTFNVATGSVVATKYFVKFIEE